MKSNLISLICILLSSLLVTSCVHFSSSSFKEEFSYGELNFVNGSDTVFIKTNNYVNWSNLYSVNTEVADALIESFRKKNINVQVLSEYDVIPDSYYEITSIVDNTVDDEWRSFSPLSILSGMWMGLSVFVLPAFSSDFTVLVKINRYSNNEIISSHLFSSHMYYMVGISMLPFVRSNDVGDDVASIVTNITNNYLGSSDNAL